MPTYRFRRKNGKEFEVVMMMSELDEYREKHPNLELCIPSTLNIISGTGTLDGKTSSGWKDVLGKISEAHPRSNLAKQYGKRSTKDIKVQSTIEKHRKIRQQRTQGR
jgi:hypothetical protein